MLASYLLYRVFHRYSLDEVVASIRAIPTVRLVTSAAFAAASYACLTGFDWLGRAPGKPLSYSKAAIASFTALSIGHNLGVAALSSGAVRYRFYSRWGLTTEEVAKVVLCLRRDGRIGSDFARCYRPFAIPTMPERH